MLMGNLQGRFVDVIMSLDFNFYGPGPDNHAPSIRETLPVI
jgi:hypothetical protein